MFSISFGELRTVYPVVMNLASQTFPARQGAVRTMYWIGNLAQKLGSALSTAQKEEIKVIKKHAKLDDKGDFIPKMQPATETEPEKAIPGTYIILDGHRELLQKDLNEFAAIPALEMKCDKFKIDDFDGVTGLSPEALLALDPIIDMQEEKLADVLLLK
jgi:hypothetical protein